jgi:hypothetical protein
MISVEPSFSELICLPGFIRFPAERAQDCIFVPDLFAGLG